MTNRFTVAILVHNQFGVLNRVTSMFRRRQFNIRSLTVSETESDKYSRITILSEGDEIVKQQLINQLYKLPVVVSVAELDPEETVSRELLLIKVANNAENRADVRAAIDAFEAKILDYNQESMMIQMVGDSRKTDDFINLLLAYNILEICRTGVVALERGSSTIRNVTNF
ncbi:MAG: acetolactate synthase small subunit [Oscillospiraceae bacterium]|nr:acetolactate synthase small subunit [Oscillospiraceae bacterium]